MGPHMESVMHSAITNDDSFRGSFLIGPGEATPELHRGSPAPYWPTTWRHGQFEIGIEGYFVWPERILTGRSPEDQARLAEALTDSPVQWARAVRNGAFCIVIHDHHQRRTLFVTDALGLIPLYLHKGPGRACFAGDLQTLRRITGVNHDLDATGLAELYAFGYQLGDRTALKDVAIVPRASVMTISWDDGSEQRESWTIEKASAETSSAAHEELAERVVDAMRVACDRLHDPALNYAIKISGGMDSRLIAATFDHGPVRAYTWGDPGSREMRIGSALANALGFPHTTIAVEGDFFTPVYPSMHARFGLMEFFHELATPLIVADGCDTTLDGLGGDALVGGLFLKRSASTRDVVASALGRPLSQRTLPRGEDQAAEMLFETLRVGDAALPILTPEAGEQLRRARADVLGDLVGQMREHRRPDDTLDSLIARVKLANRTRRYIALQAAPARPGLQTLYPFLDADVMRLAESLPAELTANKRLYLMIFSRLLPSIRHVPPIMSCLPFTVPVGMHYAGRIVRRLRELSGYRLTRLTRGRLRPATMEATQWEKWLATNADFRGAVQSHLRRSPMVDPAALDRAFSEVADYRRVVRGTRLMLTASYCSWWT